MAWAQYTGYSAVCTKTLKGLSRLKISNLFHFFGFSHILWVYLIRKTCGQHQFTSLNILGHPIKEAPKVLSLFFSVVVDKKDRPVWGIFLNDSMWYGIGNLRTIYIELNNLLLANSACCSGCGVRCHPGSQAMNFFHNLWLWNFQVPNDQVTLPS